MADSIARVCRIDELAANSVRRLDFGDKAICVYNIGGRFYATDDVCSHGQSSLSEVGELNGEVVECGRHFGGFHVPTGKAVLPPCSVALRTYETVVRDGELFVKVG